MAEPLLSLQKLRAGYGDALVLHDVTLELPENGSLALLGRNGVGKSTQIGRASCRERVFKDV